MLLVAVKAAEVLNVWTGESEDDGNDLEVVIGVKLRGPAYVASSTVAGRLRELWVLVAGEGPKSLSIRLGDDPRLIGVDGVVAEDL
jgi:hypothetical protein